MSYRNRFGSFGQPPPRADFMDCVKNVRAKVPVSTPVADADYYILQNDDLRNTTCPDGMLNVNDVQVVLSHLFCCMGGHVISPKPELFPDPFDP